MGEVYRATDTKLKRAVALKVLPDSFANDPDRLARFQREAKSSLAESSEHRPHLRPGAVGRRAARSSWNWSRGRRSLTASRRGRFPSMKRCPLRSRLPKPSKPRTSKASSTAT